MVQPILTWKVSFSFFLHNFTLLLLSLDEKYYETEGYSVLVFSMDLVQLGECFGLKTAKTN